MARNCPDFVRFVRRVQRRFTVVRALECMGLGALGGCAMGIPLILIVLWRGGQAALPVAIASILVGAAVGLLRGIFGRPTPLAGAMEADRQLGWADLLSSAWNVRDCATFDPWVASLVAAANDRCRGALPSSVILNRLGARAWGGISLATALVLVLGLMPTYATLTQASDGRFSAANALADLQHIDSQRQAPSRSFSRRTPSDQEPADETGNRMNSQSPQQAQARPGELNPAGNDSHRVGEGTQPNGRGTGASHSNPPQPGSLKSPTGTDARQSNSGGSAASGAGRPANSQTNGTGAATDTAAGPEPVGAAPPWRSEQWPRDVQRARDALQRGDVPDAYRDVVRDYFERP